MTHSEFSNYFDAKLKLMQNTAYYKKGCMVETSFINNRRFICFVIDAVMIKNLPINFMIDCGKLSNGDFMHHMKKHLKKATFSNAIRSFIIELLCKQMDVNTPFFVSDYITIIENIENIEEEDVLVDDNAILTTIFLRVLRNLLTPLKHLKIV